MGIKKVFKVIAIFLTAVAIFVGSSLMMTPITAEAGWVAQSILKDKLDDESKEDYMNSTAISNSVEDNTINEMLSTYYTASYLNDNGEIEDVLAVKSLSEIDGVYVPVAEVPSIAIYLDSFASSVTLNKVYDSRTDKVMPFNITYIKIQYNENTKKNEVVNLYSEVEYTRIKLFSYNPKVGMTGIFEISQREEDEIIQWSYKAQFNITFGDMYAKVKETNKNNETAKATPTLPDTDTKNKSTEKSNTTTKKSYDEFDDECSLCYGLGECDKCFGEGYIDCSSCFNGRCSKCGGSGEIMSYGYQDIKTRDCSKCGGDGMCTRCDGMGEIKCSRCNGKGTCPRCGQ